MNEKENKTLKEIEEEKTLEGIENEVEDSDPSTVQKEALNYLKKINDEEIYTLFAPIQFEGSELKELPLTGMGDIRGKHFSAANNLLRAEGKTWAIDNWESADFALAVLRVVTGLAIEVIKELRPMDYRILVNVVQGFLSRRG